MTSGVARWDASDDSLGFSMQGEIIQSVLMASVMWLQFSVQEELILVHTNGKCHLCKLVVNL